MNGLKLLCRIEVCTWNLTWDCHADSMVMCEAEHYPKMRLRFKHTFIRGASFNKTMEPLQLNMRNLKSVLGLVAGHYYVKTPVKFLIVLYNNSAWKGYIFALYYKVRIPFREHY